MKIGDRVKIAGYYSCGAMMLTSNKTHSFIDQKGVVVDYYSHPEDGWDVIVKIDNEELSVPFNIKELEVI